MASSRLGYAGDPPITHTISTTYEKIQPPIHARAPSNTADPSRLLRTPASSGLAYSTFYGTDSSGIRVRAERPFPANGPLWFARRWRSLRGDRSFGTRLEVEWSPDAENVVFDWAGPYRAW